MEFRLQLQACLTFISMRVGRIELMWPATRYPVRTNQSLSYGKEYRQMATVRRSVKAMFSFVYCGGDPEMHMPRCADAINLLGTQYKSAFFFLACFKTGTVCGVMLCIPFSFQIRDSYTGSDFRESVATERLSVFYFFRGTLVCMCGPVVNHSGP